MVKPGQDCSTASFICSTSPISAQNVTGAGANNDEAKGTCLSVPGQVSESNSAWYKWEAANSGTLYVYTVIPTDTLDDIDWVLFDLGPSGDCSGVRPENAIRCKAGYGVSNATCPGTTTYYKTGLDFKATTVSEPPGCGQGQTGKLKFVTMVQGHIYALLLNNFSSANNGFTLVFTDQQGKAGTGGTFAGHSNQRFLIPRKACAPRHRNLLFSSQSINYDTLKWSFGDGASLSAVTGAGPYAVSYTTAGLKTVTLDAIGLNGCGVVSTQQIPVGIKPPLPVIQADKSVYCVGDTIRLTVQPVTGITYSWTGPTDGFTADSSTA